MSSSPLSNSIINYSDWWRDHETITKCPTCWFWRHGRRSVDGTKSFLGAVEAVRKPDDIKNGFEECYVTIEEWTRYFSGVSPCIAIEKGAKMTTLVWRKSWKWNKKMRWLQIQRAKSSHVFRDSTLKASESTSFIRNGTDFFSSIINRNQPKWSRRGHNIVVHTDPGDKTNMRNR